MKRRQFILAAAVASMYTPIALGKEKIINDLSYFDCIGALKTKAYTSNVSLTSYLDTQTKSLRDIGYTQEHRSYVYSENFNKHILFVPYTLTLNSEILDSQYLVVETDDFKNFQKITTLSLDFLKAVNLASAKLHQEYDRNQLINLLLPKAEKRTDASQLFLTQEGHISYILRIESIHKEHSLRIHNASKKLSFVFKTDNEALIS